MWRSFDKRIVQEELRTLRTHGLNVTRSFFYWPDFMPKPDTIDETYVDRYRVFLDICAAEDITTIPTFIVGHMSGENWDVSWRDGRNLYSDGWMLAQQAFFVREMTQRLKDHPAVVG
jgi:endo-1,4-beta-mannosidase